MITEKEIWDTITKRETKLEEGIKRIEVFSALTEIFKIMKNVCIGNGKPIHNTKKQECYDALQKIQDLLETNTYKTIILYCEVEKEKET